MKLSDYIKIFIIVAVSQPIGFGVFKFTDHLMAGVIAMIISMFIMLIVTGYIKISRYQRVNNSRGADK